MKWASLYFLMLCGAVAARAAAEEPLGLGDDATKRIDRQVQVVEAALKAAWTSGNWDQIVKAIDQGGLKVDDALHQRLRQMEKELGRPVNAIELNDPPPRARQDDPKVVRAEWVHAQMWLAGLETDFGNAPYTGPPPPTGRTVIWFWGEATTPRVRPMPGVVDAYPVVERPPAIYLHLLRLKWVVHYMQKMRSDWEQLEKDASAGKANWNDLYWFRDQLCYEPVSFSAAARVAAWGSATVSGTPAALENSGVAADIVRLAVTYERREEALGKRLAKKAATELVKDEDFADLRQFMAGDFAQMQASTLDGQALEKTVKAWGTIQAERTKLLGGWPAQVAAVVALRKERDNASNTFIEKLAKREIKAAGLGEYRAAQAARDQKTEAAINDAFVTLKRLKALDDLERALPLPSWSVPPRLKLFAQCVQGPLEIEQFYAGVPTVVEVAFDAPQREGRCEVTIEVGGAKLKLTARRDAAEPRRFVSETFVPGADADAIKKEDAFDPPVRPKPEKENP